MTEENILKQVGGVMTPMLKDVGFDTNQSYPDGGQCC